MATHANSIGQFTHIAKPTSEANSLSFEPERQTYRMRASEPDATREDQAISLAWHPLEGDFIVRAQIHWPTDSGEQQTFGWEVRESLDPDSKYLLTGINALGEATTRFYQPANPSSTSHTNLGALNQPSSSMVLQLERRGETFITSAAHFGEPLQILSSIDSNLPTSLFAGLSLGASPGSPAVEINNLRLIKPAPEGFTPYQDYIGSHLEVMDMRTFNRRILHSAPNSLQAPNWTRDGKALIYNSDGLLYRFDLGSHSIEPIETGFAKDNNNDHVLSWDGRHIGISHHAVSEQGRSTIYTLPLGGSDKPVQVTHPGVGHSYLHGFAPDDQSLVFTADRKGQYDIYSVAIKTGEEHQLTDTPTLDDGAEYSPDGRYIYFNSNRTGTMQLWRMRADGSDQQQLTFDEYNDWFPHVSPDGETLVFISYAAEIDSEDHPFYRHVYLRQMPAAGGNAQVIGYLYGGQGSLNVHSWSPDGSHIAFISNSQWPLKP
ncbi:hypothetical protein [Gilvimarinus sp. DA14]|uniref:TolB family protein n=1 Tax=Gilvimarinus sp. DA14 TaxID=2956798 RepID=UPI0020B67AF0|nr:hypothetical protein [Gilvimarinus sp. DA14]UTF58729.1 hypothetical protein NHM04_09575 [Gilvimarinus sp. DA14]